MAEVLYGQEEPSEQDRAKVVVESGGKVSHAPADLTTAEAPPEPAPEDENEGGDNPPADPEEPPEEPPEDGSQDPEEKKGRAQERIRELVARNKEAEKRAAEAQTAADNLRSQHEEALRRIKALEERIPQAQNPSTEGDKKKAPEEDKGLPQFKDYFLEDIGDYDMDAFQRDTAEAIAAQVTDKVTKMTREEVAQKEAEANLAQSIGTFNAKEADFRKTLADPLTYDNAYGVVVEVVGKAPPVIANEFMAAILDTDVGPQVVMELGKDPERLRAVTRDPRTFVRYLGSVEERVRSGNKETPRTPGKGLPKAPPPPETAPRAGTPKAREGSLDGLSPEEYARRRGLDNRGW